MKYTSLDNLTYFWSKAKAYADAISTTLSNALSTLTKSDVGLGNVDNTADADKPVSTATQTALDAKQDKLVSGTTIKTVNGASLLGSGNISIDLTLYKVVTALPTSGIDTTKIYLLLSETSGDSNKYTEYVYVSSAWEKIGEYTATVDLTPYATTESVETALALKADASDTYTKAEVDSMVTESGTFSEADATKLAGIEEGATKTTVDSALSSTSTNPVQNKVINTALAAKQATLTAGTNITISGTTISAKDTTYSAATTSAAGLMSAVDKTKLDGIATGATADEALTTDEIDAIFE